MTGFVILLTFMVAAGAPDSAKTIRCPAQPCVDRVIAASWQSTRLARLRVYRADEFGELATSGATLWPPISDEWMS